MEQAYEIEKLNNEANINEEDTKIGEDKINKDNIWILYIVVGIIIVILIIFCYLKHKKNEKINFCFIKYIGLLLIT